MNKRLHLDIGSGFILTQSHKYQDNISDLKSTKGLPFNLYAATMRGSQVTSESTHLRVQKTNQKETKDAPVGPLFSHGATRRCPPAPLASSSEEGPLASSQGTPLGRYLPASTGNPASTGKPADIFRQSRPGSPREGSRRRGAQSILL